MKSVEASVIDSCIELSYRRRTKSELERKSNMPHSNAQAVNDHAPGVIHGNTHQGSGGHISSNNGPKSCPVDAAILVPGAQSSKTVR